MYTWQMALAESSPYLAFLCVYAAGVSFLSAFAESLFRVAAVSYSKLLCWNLGVSMVGVLVITSLWVSTGLRNEDFRLMVGPLLALFAMYFLKVFLYTKTSGARISVWLVSLLHPLLLCALPWGFLAYVSALARAYQH